MRRHLLAGCSLLSLIACAADSPSGTDGAIADLLADQPALDAAADTTPPDSSPGSCAPGEALLARLDPARMLLDVEFLVGLQERISPGAQGQAAVYVYTELASVAGVSVSQQPYAHGGAPYVNVLAEITGEAPAPVVLGSAHFDSRSTDPVRAPGADDNASGVAALLEVARALSGCRPALSVKLLFTSNEEPGAIGSSEWMKAYGGALPPENVAGLINVDMVGYAAEGEDLDLTAEPPSQTLVAELAPLVTQWSSLAVKQNAVEGFGCGDDKVFAAAGYRALCVIAEYNGEAPNPTANPYFHTPEDTLDKLNLAFHAQAARALLAMICGLANPGE